MPFLFAWEDREKRRTQRHNDNREPIQRPIDKRFVELKNLQSFMGKITDLQLQGDKQTESMLILPTSPARAS